MLKPTPSQKFGALWQVALRRPAQMGSSVVCLLIATLLEGIGLLALLPGIALFLNGEIKTNDPHPVVRTFNAVMTEVGVEPNLEAFLALIVIIICLKTVITLLAQIQVSVAQSQSVEVMRRELLSSLFVAQWQFFISQRAGRITNAVSNEAQSSGMLYSQLADIFALSLQFVVYIAAAVLIAWEITIGAMVAGALMVLLLSRLIVASQRNSRRLTALMSNFNARLVDGLAGIKSLKAMGLVRRLEPLLQSDIIGLRKILVQQLVLKKLLISAQEIIRTVALVSTIYVFSRYQPASIEALVAVAFVFMRTLESFGRLQKQWQSITISAVPYDHVTEMIEMARLNIEENRGRITQFSLARGIALEGINFSYGNLPELSGTAAKRGPAPILVDSTFVPVLENFSLEIPAGKFLCVLGGSGAGKTTLVDLIIGLITAQSGTITVDGVPLSSIEVDAWRRIIGYVPQEVFLFNASIRENITLGDSEIADADIEYAIKASGAWDFVAKLKDGVDSPVGERGALLSGGQRQRICIARALARRPKLLILDEATSALDSKTEMDIAETVRSLTPEMTVVAITHRPALADRADQVIHLSNGAIKQIVHQAA